MSQDNSISNLIWVKIYGCPGYRNCTLSWDEWIAYELKVLS